MPGNNRSVLKYILLFLMAFYSAFSFGQAKVKRIREVNPYQKESIYIFPLIILSNNKPVSDKINDQLMRDILDIDKKHVKKSIFENVWAAKQNPMLRVNDISYEVLNNTSKIFSISISAEGCGAYCETYTSYYSFDMTSGKKIGPDSLFNKSGARLLLDSINARKKALLAAKLIEVQDSLHSVIVLSSPDEKKYYEEMLDLYERCQENPESNLEYDNFYLRKSTFVIILDRCSAHYNRNADELEGSFVFEFLIKDWNNYLSSYMRKLIK